MSRRPSHVRPRDAASLVLHRQNGAGEMLVLMGRRAPRHRFLPELYVFPGGRLDPDDSRATAASPLRPDVAARLARHSSPRKAFGLAMAAVRETFEETGLLIGAPLEAEAPGPESWQHFYRTGQAPALAHIDFIARALSPPPSPIRFNARFFVIDGDHAEGRLGGSGELLDLDWYPLAEALKLPLADVTEFVLDTALDHIESPPEPDADRPVPVFLYRNEISHIRYA